MKLCAVSFKECWQADGRWWSSGGFPLQMAGIASLFDSLTLAIVEGAPRAGGLPLPEGAEIVRLRPPRGENLRRKLSVLTGLPSYLASLVPAIRRADVVHVPLPGDIPLVALLVAVLGRKRVIARYGGSWTRTDQTTLMNVITRTMMRILAGGRNVMLATGEGVDPPARGVHWLFATAISEAEVRAVRPNLDRPAGDPLRLIYAGRLSKEKGVEALIEALGCWVKQATTTSGVRLVVAGDGPMRAWMEARVRDIGCEHMVEFAGLLDRRGLLERMLQADLCVLPSLSESFCKARLDAMLCGVPVLTTDVGFGRMLVGADAERGWIVPSGDAPALAAALVEVTSFRSEWPALRRRCRDFVGRYTLEDWTKQIGRIAATQWGGALVEGRLKLQ